MRVVSLDAMGGIRVGWRGTMSLSYTYPPQYAYPSAPAVYRAFPSPPRLHWVWVLVLSIVTAGIFWMVWMVVQARWVQRATGNARPLGWAMAYLVFVVGTLLVAMGGSVYLTLTGQHSLVADFMDTLQNLRRAVGFLLYIASAFTMKSALESQPFRISLHGLATFFFGPVYFQSCLKDYNVEGKVGFGAMADQVEAPPQA